jgi:tRNA dimethylallyltransferase
MYVDALIKNYDLSKSTQRSDKYSNLNNNELYDKLLGLNKEKALEIGKSNTKRLIRALQIIDEHGNFDKKNKMLYEPLYVNCELEREEVYKRINQRVDLMFKNG